MARESLLWPGVERHVRKAKQFLATGAVDSLHSHSLEKSSDKTGEIGGIGVIRQITLQLCSFETSAEGILFLDSQRNQSPPDSPRLCTPSQSCLYRHASMPRPAAGKKLGRLVQDSFRYGVGRRLV